MAFIMGCQDGAVGDKIVLDLDLVFTLAFKQDIDVLPPL